MVQWTSTLLFSAPDIFISGQPTVIHQQPPPARSQASPAPSNLDPTAASTAINWLDYGMKIPCVIYIYIFIVYMLQLHHNTIYSRKNKILKLSGAQIFTVFERFPLLKRPIQRCIFKPI